MKILRKPKEIHRLHAFHRNYRKLQESTGICQSTQDCPGVPRDLPHCRLGGSQKVLFWNSTELQGRTEGNQGTRFNENIV